MLAGVQVGALELEYSAWCGAGWARLYLYPSRPTMMGSVTVESPDGRLSAIGNPLVKQRPIFTNVIVVPSGGCLGAQGTVSATGAVPVSAAIACQAPPAS
ncbi:hypothetical protein [Dactylosporangium sp. NPDC048998]|uniref:hypothetical protein n=1 Tax=Dactylosporangium sp. NPDC048998 TaxID=3363976 RepID=UPI0037214F46